jgi:hypothetical protein
MLDLKHGGHILVVENEEKDPGARDVEERLGYRVQESVPLETPFAYLLPALEVDPNAHLPGLPEDVVPHLKALGAAMVDDPAPLPDDSPEVNSTIPTVYTYWGQFIDHDITANTDRNSEVSDITRDPLVPIPPDDVKAKLTNLRRPNLDLDSVYGDGPKLPGCFRGNGDPGLYDGIKLRIGELTGAPGGGIPGVAIPNGDPHRDLPRIAPLLDAGVITEDDIPESLRSDVNRKTRAFIGDLRNDENLIVAQLHVAFIRFHNNVVEAIEADPVKFGLRGNSSAAEKFLTARRLVRFHYQWLVVNDYLKTVTIAGIVDKVLVGGNKFYEPLADDVLFAPLEYSVAAFRFGHTMVRAAYDHNRNFGKESNVAPQATFEQEFLFTGNGFQFPGGDISKPPVPNPFLGTPTLPFNWAIEWDRFSRKTDPDRKHFARKIDTRLVPPIHRMVNEGNDPGIQDDTDPKNSLIRHLLRDLAQRNLLRGYLLSLPTGQAVAGAMGVAPLTAKELNSGNTDAVQNALKNGGFVQNTPLWFYLLKEAEVRAAGNSLGELGSRIVAETLIGLIRFDPKSFLHAHGGGWDPSKGVKLANGDPIVTIRDLFEFAGLPS